MEAVERDLQSQEAMVAELEVELASLQQRLNQGAAMVQVFDSIFSGLEEGEGAGGPSAEAVREFTPLVQASGDLALQAKWVEIVGLVLANGGPLLPGAVADITTVVQASGNAPLGKKWQEFLAAETGKGGAALLELDSPVRSSDEPALESLLMKTVEIIFQQGEPPGELLEELRTLAEASGNTEIQQGFFALSASPPLSFEEIGAKLKVVGDPSLDTLFEIVSHSQGGESFDAFFEGLLAAMNRTLGSVDSEGQR